MYMALISLKNRSMLWQTTLREIVNCGKTCGMFEKADYPLTEKCITGSLDR
jgi:hypothetical protein